MPRIARPGKPDKRSAATKGDSVRVGNPIPLFGRSDSPALRVAFQVLTV